MSLETEPFAQLIIGKRLPSSAKVGFYQHQSASPFCCLQKMTDKTGRERRFHFMKASVLLGHADEPHALDP